MTVRGRGWTHIRVRRTTKARLQAHCRAMTAAAQAGLSTRDLSDQPVTGGCQGGLTIDQAVQDLLDRDDAHRDRARRQRARRAAARAEDSGAAEQQDGMLDLDELARTAGRPLELSCASCGAAAGQWCRPGCEQREGVES